MLSLKRCLRADPWRPGAQHDYNWALFNDRLHVAKTHLEALTLLEMTAYLDHHLKVAGVSHSPFIENTAQAIHQGSGGFLRKANLLARGALIAAAREKSQLVTAEHVRLAATELI